MHCKKYLLVFLITTFTWGAILAWSFGETASDNIQWGAQRGKGSITERGPLRVHPSNPRYFTDGSGKAIYLTGSHTWLNLQDRGHSHPPPQFDYEKYLEFMQSHNHNFMRMWVWENAWETNTKGLRFIDPTVYPKTNTEVVFGGKFKFDLKRFNRTYFHRLRERVVAAQDRGIYVSVMLFQGWSIERKTGFSVNPWAGHPFNRNNNINNINGDLDGDGKGSEVHTLLNPTIIKLQETYVRRVIDTLNDLDNVLYEISNESPATPENTKWQYHFVNLIRNYEANKAKQHPVLITWPWPPVQDNNKLFASPAEAISPSWGGRWKSPNEDYRNDPPAGDGRKVVISDTDHLWGIGGDHQWVWKSFLRGLNPIFMDPYTEEGYLDHPSKPGWELIRKNMGYTLTYARKMNFSSMVPHNDLCSTKYCLANPGGEYLIYLPSRGHRGLRWLDRFRLDKWVNWLTPYLGWNGRVKLDLSGFSETFHLEWFNPRTGEIIDGGAVKGGGEKSFTAPMTGDAVLYIYKPLFP